MNNSQRSSLDKGGRERSIVSNQSLISQNISARRGNISAQPSIHSRTAHNSLHQPTNNSLRQQSELEQQETYSLLHSNTDGKCMLDYVCLSNECNSRQKICCEECAKELHSNHIEKVEEFCHAYRQLKRAMHDRKVILERSIKLMKQAYEKSKKLKQIIRDRIFNNFKTIDIHCEHRHNSEILNLREDFSEIYKTKLFHQLEEVVESNQKRTTAIEENLIKLTNEVFVNFISEFYPNLGFKGKDEAGYLTRKEEKMNRFKAEQKKIDEDLIKSEKKVRRVRSSTSSIKMINFHGCATKNFVLEQYKTTISQILVLGHKYLVVSVDSQQNPRDFIELFDLEDETIKLICSEFYQHKKLINIKSSQAIVVITSSALAKYVLIGTQLVKAMETTLLEPIIDAEYVSEFDLMYVITKDKNDQLHQRVNVFSVFNFTLIKRYFILTKSSNLLICCSASLNILVTAETRTVTLYNLLNGEILKYFLIGSTIFDKIVDIKFQPKIGNSLKENLIVSSMNGMVTSICFSGNKVMRKEIIPTKRESIYFCLVEDLKLFVEPRILLISVEKGTTKISNCDPKKKNLIQQDATIIESEYSCHYLFTTCDREDTSYTLFIGTSLGSIYIIQYANQDVEYARSRI